MPSRAARADRTPTPSIHDDLCCLSTAPATRYAAPQLLFPNHQKAFRIPTNAKAYGNAVKHLLSSSVLPDK